MSKPRARRRGLCSLESSVKRKLYHFLYLTSKRIENALHPHVLRYNRNMNYFPAHLYRSIGPQYKCPAKSEHAVPQDDPSLHETKLRSPCREFITIDRPGEKSNRKQVFLRAVVLGANQDAPPWPAILITDIICRMHGTCLTRGGGRGG